MIKLIKVINILALAFAGSLVAVSLAFAYALLSPIDVVQGWKITVDEQTYRPGDSIVMHASYKKTRDVSGTAYYYLECKNPNGNLVRYPMSQTEGNRAKGEGKIDVPMKIPGEVPNLPTMCRIAVSVDYSIYTFRKFTENNATNEFRVEEKL